MSDLAVRRAICCPHCKRELVMIPMTRRSGKFVVEFRCTKHGTVTGKLPEAMIPAGTPRPQQRRR
jgi:hypothetical protein